jgi:hypothetical protein
MNKKITSKRLRGMMFVPLVLAMMMPIKVAAQGTLNEMFKTWHIAKQADTEGGDYVGKLAQGYIMKDSYIGDDKNTYYIDKPIYHEIYLPENAHSYVNRIPFKIFSNIKGTH